MIQLGWRVAAPPVRLSLFRIRSGTEEELRPQLDDMGLLGTPNKFGAVGQCFITLGPYDLIAISSSPAFPERSIGRKHPGSLTGFQPFTWLQTFEDLRFLRGATHAHNIPAFRWVRATELAKRAEALTAWFSALADCFAFVFVKLAPAPGQMSPLLYHSIVSEWLENRSGPEWVESRGAGVATNAAPSVHVLGEFRWNDLVVIIGHASLRAIFDFVLWLRHSTQSAIGVAQCSSSSTPLLQTTYTIPAFGYSKWCHGALDALLDEVRAKVYFEVEAGHDGELRDAVIRCLPSRLSHPGALNDIKFEFVPGQWDYELSFGDRLPLGELLAFGRKVRAATAAIPMASTRSLLAMPADIEWPDVETQVKTQTKTQSSCSIQVGEEDLNELRQPLLAGSSVRYLPMPVAELSDMLNTCSATMADRVDRGRYADMYNFGEAVAADVLQHKAIQKLEDETDQEDQWNQLVSRVEHGITRFWEGFAQRSGGGRGAVSRSSELQTAFGGSLNRVVAAAESIPRYMLHELLGVTWDGFVVFDRLLDFERHPYGVLVVPRRYLFSPRWWWHLAHEAAHDYAAGQRLLGKLLLPRLEAVDSKKEQLLDPDDRWRVREKDDLVRYYLTECFCDLVGGRATFGVDREFFVRMFWGSMMFWRDGSDGAQIVQGIVRMVLFSLLSGDGRKSVEMTNAVVNEQLVWLQGVVSKTVVPRSGAIFSHIMDSLTSTFWQHVECVREFWTLFPELASIADTSIRQQLQDPAVNEAAAARVAAGEPVAGLVDPLGLICYCMKIEKPDWDGISSNGALVLTLWDIASRQPLRKSKVLK